jgi:subtilisin family serine protease
MFGSHPPNAATPRVSPYVHLRRGLRALLLPAFCTWSFAANAQLDVTELAKEQPELVARLALVRNSSWFGQQPRPLSADIGASTRRGLRHLPSAEFTRWLTAPEAERAAQRVVWSAPRRLLMDRARHWIGLERLSEQLTEGQTPTLTGQGVVVGVVDGGIDFTHPDFQDADGTSRIAWLLDFGLPPLGIHPELEHEYGCDGDDAPCGILGRAELDLMIDGERVATADGLYVSPVPDRLGHGTHVTSLAAGNGRSLTRYQGVAPEATLIVANASDDASVSDALVLNASRFIFERAAELGMPAVVNLSLGGDFGPHDGSSAVEAALGELVELPGRALVVAAGNSGTLYQGDLEGYAGPFGVHTDVHIAHDSDVRVPVLLPSSEPGTESAVLVWIQGPANDTFRVGLERANGDTLLPPISPGHAVGSRDEGREILLINQVSAPALEGGENFSEGAVVVVSGDLSGARVLALRLQGEGNAHLWVESLGAIAQGAGGQGAVFPGATRAGTVTIPATSPRVIAVGATVNRNTWPSRDDGNVDLADFGLPRFSVPNTPAFFSSQGPNLAGVMKPDILAPGFAVVGAMGRNASPVAGGVPNPLSMFAFSPVCDVSSVCSVVDDAYGVAVGTSMAAPIVTGVVALLLQRSPGSTQTELLRLIQAGARRLPDNSERANPGIVDVVTSMRALDILAGADAPAPDPASFLSLGVAFAYPDPQLPVAAQLHLRAGSELADADADAITVHVEHGALLEPPRRLAPGLIAFRVAASAGSAEQRMTIRALHAGHLLTERQIPIAVDPNVAQRGASVRGGCAFTTHSTLPARGMGFPAALLLLSGLYSMRARASRRARCQGSAGPSTASALEPSSTL